MIGFPPGTGALLTPATRRRLVLSLVGSVLLSVLDMLGVLAMLPMMQFVSGAPRDAGALGVVNDWLGNPSESTLIAMLALFIVGAFATKDVIAIYFRIWQLHFMAEQEVRTSVRLLRGYLVGPYAWHLVRNTGDKLWTVDYAVTIGFATGIASALSLASEVFTIVLIFAGLLFVAPGPSLLALAYFGVAGLLMQRIIRPRVTDAGKRSLDASQITSSTSIQALGAAKEIKLRRAEARFMERYTTARETGAHARATAVILNEIPKYLLEITFVVGIALLAFVVTKVSGAERALVLLGLFVAAGSRLLPSMVRLIGALGGIRFSRAPLEHLIRESRMQSDAEREENEGVSTTEVPTGDIEVRGVRFSYENSDDQVLDGVDATIRAGTSVALVGSSGAGKSTLVDVLLGLHRPSGGSVTAGGINVFDNLPGWQRQLAVVPQDVYLLDESLSANIAFDEEQDPDRLAEALERAQLQDLVAGLPEGLATEVGERGVRLSGGQRQRIGIARALYRRPAVLVLDEATSALDNETERRLTRTIESLAGSMTMIIVAHRLSTVRHCDQLIFMSGGRAVSHGTFEEVRASNAEFAHLVALGSLSTPVEQDEPATPLF